VVGVLGIGVLFVMDYLVLGDKYPFQQFGGGKAVAVLACLVVMGLSVVVYTVARLFLLVKSFRSLVILIICLLERLRQCGMQVCHTWDKILPPVEELKVQDTTVNDPNLALIDFPCSVPGCRAH